MIHNHSLTHTLRFHCFDENIPEEVYDHDGRSRWDLPDFVLLLLLSYFDSEAKC